MKKQPLHFPNDTGLPQQSSSYSQASRSINNNGHSRKYSSASTLAIQEAYSSIEAFEQLVKKYNLFVYLPHIEPPPGYEENNHSYPSSNASRQSDSGRNSTLIHSATSTLHEYIDFGFQATTLRMDDAITVERRGGPVEAVPGVCGVPARLTGFSSFVIQAITLLISCALTILFLLHIGGYAYYYNVVTTTIGNNETIPIADDFNRTYSDNFTNNVQDEVNFFEKIRYY